MQCRNYWYLFCGVQNYSILIVSGGCNWSLIVLPYNGRSVVLLRAKSELSKFCTPKNKQVIGCLLAQLTMNFHSWALISLITLVLRTRVIDEINAYSWELVVGCAPNHPITNTNFSYLCLLLGYVLYIVNYFNFTRLCKCSY